MTDDDAVAVLVEAFEGLQADRITAMAHAVRRAGASADDAVDYLTDYYVTEQRPRLEADLRTIVLKYLHHVERQPTHRPA